MAGVRGVMNWLENEHFMNWQKMLGGREVGGLNALSILKTTLAMPLLPLFSSV